MANERINNPILDSLLEMRAGSRPTVAEGFYESTVFGSERTYNNSLKQIENKVLDSNRRKMVNTPLVVSPQPKAIYNCESNQGVAIGFYYVDYRTHLPLLCVMCDVSAGGYTYKSTYYDVKEEAWKDGRNVEQSLASVNELIQFCSTNIGLDMDVFVQS
jgi:hypothetical protein